MKFEHTVSWLRAMKEAGELSCGCFAVGDRSGDSFRFCLDGTTEHTLFDMASVTKIAATTSLFLLAQSEGRIHWNQRIGDFFKAPADKENIPLWRILTHSAGITPFYLGDRTDDPAKAAAFLLAEPLLYEPGTRVVYCCNGFMLLAKLLENLYGAGLDALFAEKIAPRLGMGESRFCPPQGADIACHQDGRFGVNDENAAFLGGVSGNAGLFSSLDDMSRYAIELANGLPSLIPPELFAETVKNYTPGLEEARGIGWKLVDPACTQTGRLFPSGSWGHCGHTGQSVFVSRETGMWALLLTNATYHHTDYSRVCEMRAEFHNALADDLGL